MKISRIAGGLIFCLTLVSSPAQAQANDSYPPLSVLLSSSVSTIGQNISYPVGPAKITAAIVTMQPGQKTGWHKHEVPLFAYIMEGQLSVDYGSAGVKIYHAGDSFIEAFSTEHNGENTGREIVRIMAVFAGSQNIPNTIMEK